MTTINIFTTPLFITKVNNTKIKNKMIKKLNNAISKKHTLKISNEGGAHTVGFGQDKDLTKIFEEKINEYFTSLNIKKKFEWYICNYWINKNNKGDFNVPHSHVSEHIQFSGIWYLDVPQNGAKVVFLNPDKTISMGFTYNFFDDPVAYSYYSVCPENGVLLLFPSNVVHYVQPNLSNQARISLAFNISLKEVE